MSPARRWCQFSSYLDGQTVDEDVVPPVSCHLLHLRIHLKHLQFITILVTHSTKVGKYLIFDPYLAADVLDLGPEAGDLPHAVRNFPRGQALHNLVQLSETLKFE